MNINVKPHAVTNFELEFDRKQVEWPAGEKIPETIEEALDLGWEVLSSDSLVSEDEKTAEGTASLRKEIGLIWLHLEVPYRSTITYGKPQKPKATVHAPEKEPCQ
jgi:hypothetical protein